MSSFQDLGIYRSKNPKKELQKPKGVPRSKR